jgi:hypothetical protein
MLNWNWIGSPGDWGYPFELCATIYRKEFVENVLDRLDKAGIDPRFLTDDWGQPNRFEAMGDILVKSLEGTPPKMASFPISKASVITVNRVQDVCENQVFDAGAEMSTEKMLQMWKEGIRFDLDSYKGANLHCIHTGACFLRSKSGEVHEVGNYHFLQSMATSYLENVYEFDSGAVLNNSFVKYLQRFGEYASGSDESWDLPLSLKPTFLEKKEKFISVTESSGVREWLSQNCAAKSWELLGGQQEVCEMFEEYSNVQSGSCNKATFFEIEKFGLQEGEIHFEGAARKLVSLAYKFSSGDSLLLGIRSAPNATLNFHRFRIFSRDELMIVFASYELISEFQVTPPDKVFNEIIDYNYAYSFYLFEKR